MHVLHILSMKLENTKVYFHQHEEQIVYMYFRK